MEDQNEQEKAAELYRKSMEDALAHLDKVAEEVSRQREKAVDDQFAAQQELAKIKRDAEITFRDELDRHRKEWREEAKLDVMQEVVERLISVGRSSSEILSWFKINPEMLGEAWERLGFQLLGNHQANVTYEGNARAGNIYFNWDGHLLKFPYEMGAGPTLTVIDVPNATNWNSQTGLNPAHRMDVLEFIAQRVVRDQAFGHLYEITDDYIHIVKPSNSLEDA